MRWYGGNVNRPGPSIDFPTTRELLLQLPQQEKSKLALHAARNSHAAKGKPKWAPRHGGDDALLRQRERECRPDVQARARLTGDAKRLIIVLVGLPARGKSIIAYKLERFLNWRGWSARSFSGGELRRREHGADGLGADFFDDSLNAAVLAREDMAQSMLKEAFSFLNGGGEIAILDSSNTSVERRRRQSGRVAQFAEETGQPIEIVFVESILQSPTLLLANMRAKVLASPDFYGLDEVAAMQDLQQRCTNYEATYQTCTEEDGAFIKLYDMGSKVLAHNIYGRLASSVLPFLLELHFVPRPVFFLSIPPGGSSDGFDFNAALTNWAKNHGGPMQVLSSTQPAAIQLADAVAKTFGGTAEHLIELAPSELGGKDHPEVSSYHERLESESPADLARRLEQGLFEIEKRLEPVLVISHQAPCRALRAYLLGVPLVDGLKPGSSYASTGLSDDAQSLVELTPLTKKYGMQERVVKLQAPTPPAPHAPAPKVQRSLSR